MRTILKVVQVTDNNRYPQEDKNIQDCKTNKAFKPCDFITFPNGQLIINWQTDKGPGSLDVGPPFAEAIKDNQTTITFEFIVSGDSLDTKSRQLLTSFKFTE